MAPEIRRDWAREALAALLVFLLVWEALRPLVALSPLTDLHWLRPVLIAVGFFFLFDYFRIPLPVSLALRLLVCFGVIVHYYDSGPWYSFELWRGLFRVCREDALHVLHGHPHLVSPEMRTLLFLGGLSLVVSALYFWVALRQRPGWLTALTMVYLLAMQMLVDVDTTAGLLRVTVIGLVLAAGMQLFRLERMYAQRENEPVGRPFRWMGLSAAVIIVLLLAGWTGSFTKDTAWAETGWTAPFTGWSGHVSARSYAKSGYSDDDRQLGGNLRLSDEAVFAAETERLAYWRGEAKSVYTGQGWEKADPEGIASRSFRMRREWTEEGEVAGSTYEQAVTVVDPAVGHLLFAGGPVVEISADVPAGEIRYDPFGEGYYLPSGQKTRQYRLKVLKEPRPAPLASARKKLYLQLPPTLPDRVRALAEEVTAGAVTDAEKADRIEAYLEQNYAYRLENAEAPEPGRDFVDFFLFESEGGYCDYFSTAMTVLLRAAGVPARWVKGFTPGEVVKGPADNDGKWQVLVRNRHAHSWTEVYLEDRGWVAYDATPGFSFMDGDAAVETVAAEEEVGAGSSGWPWPWPDRGRRIGTAFAFVLAGALAGLSVWLVWRRRPVRAFVFAHGDDGFWIVPDERDDAVRMLASFVQRLYRKFGEKAPQQTMREYVASLPLGEEGKRAMLEFVEMYEEMVYGRKMPGRTAARRLKSWARRLR